MCLCWHLFAEECKQHIWGMHRDTDYLWKCPGIEAVFFDKHFSGKTHGFIRTLGFTFLCRMNEHNTINNNNTNEFDARFVSIWGHRVPSMQSSYSAEKKRCGIWMEDRRIHCKGVGRYFMYRECDNLDQTSYLLPMACLVASCHVMSYHAVPCHGTTCGALVPYRVVASCLCYVINIILVNSSQEINSSMQNIIPTKTNSQNWSTKLRIQVIYNLYIIIWKSVPGKLVLKSILKIDPKSWSYKLN